MNLKIRCFIIDDKPLALDILADYIGKVPFLELVAMTTNPLEALAWLEKENFEKADNLIFLDIQMPELSGIQFLKVLGGKSKVILTTAYPEYALEGYEHDVIDYLLKPISFERFYKAIQKAQKIIYSNVFYEGDAKLNNKDFLFVKTAYKIQKVNLNEILYIEALQNYVIIHTEKEKVITLQTIKNMEEMLSYPAFVRVHKSYIVAVGKINTIERGRIIIANKEINIGETYRERFMQLIDNQ